MTALVIALAIAACSGGSGGAKKTATGKPAACPLIASLDATAASVTRANVSDPDAFKKALDDAVTSYVATVDELKKVVPANVRADLDSVEAAVHQYRFDDAAAASQSLDDYAATTCGRATPTTIGAAPVTTTTTAK